MDRSSNSVKIEKIRQAMEAGDTAKAVETAKTVDTARLKSAADLSVIAEAYYKHGVYDTALVYYEQIYQRNPSRRILINMINLCLKLSMADMAEGYLRDFAEIAPKDFYRHIFRYRIDRLRGESVEVLIDDLELLRDENYMEDWAYELAKLYHKSGQAEKCVAECDDIILWFGTGTYVERARGLRAINLSRNGARMPEPGDEELVREVKRLMLEGKSAEEVENFIEESTTPEGRNAAYSEEDYRSERYGQPIYEEEGKDVIWNTREFGPITEEMIRQQNTMDLLQGMQVAQQIRMRIDENWETFVEEPQEPEAKEQNEDAAWTQEGTEQNGNASYTAGQYGNTEGACEYAAGTYRDAAGLFQSKPGQRGGEAGAPGNAAGMYGYRSEVSGDMTGQSRSEAGVFGNMAGMHGNRPEVSGDMGGRYRSEAEVPGKAAGVYENAAGMPGSTAGRYENGIGAAGRGAEPGDAEAQEPPITKQPARKSLWERRREGKERKRREREERERQRREMAEEASRKETEVEERLYRMLQEEEQEARLSREVMQMTQKEQTPGAASAAAESRPAGSRGDTREFTVPEEYTNIPGEKAAAEGQKEKMSVPAVNTETLKNGDAEEVECAAADAENTFEEEKEEEQPLYQYPEDILGGVEPEEAPEFARRLKEKGVRAEEFFAGFLASVPVRRQIFRCMEQFLNTRGKNRMLMITGEPGSGKTTLAKAFAKCAHTLGGLNSSRVAVIRGAGLNRMKLADRLGQLENTVLLIENASELSEEKVSEILSLLPSFAGSTGVILEDERNKMNGLFRQNTELNQHFGCRIHLPRWTAEDLFLQALSMLASREYQMEQPIAEQFLEKVREQIEGSSQNACEAVHAYVRQVLERAEKRMAGMLRSFALEGQFREADLLLIRASDL